MSRSEEVLPGMSFWDHINALRSLLLRSGCVILLFAIGFFSIMPWLFDNVVLAPCHSGFPLYKLLETLSERVPGFPDFIDDGFEVKLVNIRLASQFFVHMSLSLWLGVVAAFPVIIMLLWKFLAPALYVREKRGFLKAFIIGNVMFYFGVAAGYFLVFPLTLRFLADYQLSEAIPNDISLDSYIDSFLTLILAMGLVFELPLVAWLLGCFGLLTRRFFSLYRRHAIVVLLILAAVITPTGDPLTMIVVFLPVYGLWELSALLVPRGVPDDDGSRNETSADSDDEEYYLPVYHSTHRGSSELN